MITIFKLPKTNIGNFTTIINTTIKDTNLSFAARGLLTYLLSLPDDWDINVTHLMTQSRAKRKHILTLIDELIHFGYIRKEVIREQSGRIMRVEYKVWETPIFITVPNYIEYHRAEYAHNPYRKELLEQVLDLSKIPLESLKD